MVTPIVTSCGAHHTQREGVMWFRWPSAVRQSFSCHSNLWNHYLLHLSRACKPEPCKLQTIHFHIYAILPGRRGLARFNAGESTRPPCTRDTGYLRIKDTSALRSRLLGGRGGQQWMGGGSPPWQPLFTGPLWTRWVGDATIVKTPWMQTSALWGLF